jgi:hypothetical protein
MPHEEMDDESAPQARFLRRRQSEAVLERQQRVWSMRHVQGLAVREIAEALRVDARTVLRDLASARQHRIAEMQQDIASQEYGLVFRSVLLDRAEIACRQVSLGLLAARPGSNQHVGYVTAMIRAVEAQVKVGVALGLLGKTGDDTYPDVLAGFDPNRLSDAELEQLRWLLTEVRRWAAGGDPELPERSPTG